MDWFEEQLGDFENDYLIIDCPGMSVFWSVKRLHAPNLRIGQIELYTHHSYFPSLVSNLSRLGIRACAVYLLESQFMEDRYKFFRFVHHLHRIG